MARPIITYFGSTKTWTITLKNSLGAVITSYTVDDVLSAAVWAGKDQLAVLTPLVEWHDPAAGTVDMTITAAQLATAGVTGLYRVDLVVTTITNGEPSLGWSGPLQIEDAPGATAVLSTYATLDDVTSVAPGIEQQFQSKAGDLAGFLAQRHEARVTFEMMVTNRYRPQPGRSRRLVDAAHSAAGSYQVLSGSSDSSPPPTLAQLKTWFSTSRLLVTEQIRLHNAYLAAALVYEDQIAVSSQNAGSYAALATLYRGRAEDYWKRVVVEFDSSATVPAATASHRIDRDCTFLT